MPNLDAKFYMDMQKIKEKKYYTKPGFFSKSDIADLRGDWEVNALWAKGNKSRLDSNKSRAYKFISSLPDTKVRQLAGLYSANSTGTNMSDRKIKTLSAEAAKYLKTWRKGSPISPDELKNLAQFLLKKYKTKSKKFRR